MNPLKNREKMIEVSGCLEVLMPCPIVYELRM